MTVLTFPEPNRAPITSFGGFGAGTWVITPTGLRAIEDLEVGDLVLTRDGGNLPILAIRQATFARDALIANEHAAPVVISESALGYGTPTTELRVAPGHSVLMADDDGAERIAEAASLAGQPGILRRSNSAICYISLEFESPELVLSNGCWTGSADMRTARTQRSGAGG